MPHELIKRTDDGREIETLDVRWGNLGVLVGTTSRNSLEGASRGLASDIVGTGLLLDRDEINNLIRVLRKARDRTYGQDA